MLHHLPLCDLPTMDPRVCVRLRVCVCSASVVAHPATSFSFLPVCEAPAAFSFLFFHKQIMYLMLMLSLYYIVVVVCLSFVVLMHPLCFAEVVRQQAHANYKNI